MDKIIVIGCPGSGKSTFSRALHEKTGIPLHYLDMLYWNADRTYGTREELIEKLNQILPQNRWIIDGNYGSTMELRLGPVTPFSFWITPRRSVWRVSVSVLESPVRICPGWKSPARSTRSSWRSFGTTTNLNDPRC